MNPPSSIERTRQMQARCFEFITKCVVAMRGLAKTPEAWVIRSQLTRSATSIGANYRAAGRAMSRRVFIAKLSIALEEADESVYWLQLCVRLELLSPEQVAPLLKEGEELIRIFSASRRTAKQRLAISD
jgi:four helix bundle protein